MKKDLLLGLIVLISSSLMTSSAIGDDSRRWGELTNLAYMHFNAGQYEEALRLTKESLTLTGHEENPLSLANLSAIHKTLGNQKSADKIKDEIRKKRIELERNLSEHEEIYKEMRKKADIRSASLPLGPISEQAFKLMSIRKTINFYLAYEKNAERGRVEHSLWGRSQSQFYQPEVRTEKTYYASGELWKIFTYADADLIRLQEFDKQQNVIFDQNIEF